MGTGGFWQLEGNNTWHWALLPSGDAMGAIDHFSGQKAPQEREGGVHGHKHAGAKQCKTPWPFFDPGKYIQKDVLSGSPVIRSCSQLSFQALFSQLRTHSRLAKTHNLCEVSENCPLQTISFNEMYLQHKYQSTQRQKLSLSIYPSANSALKRD